MTNLKETRCSFERYLFFCDRESLESYFSKGSDPRSTPPDVV